MMTELTTTTKANNVLVPRPTAFGDQLRVNTSPVSLTWNRVAVVANGGAGATLLYPDSGALRPGLHAVIGPTGAGKTTFLNALAGQTHANVEQRGTVTVNGKRVSGDSAKTVLSYVAQEDTLDGNLTVWECMSFAARMQLGHLSVEERDVMVAGLLEEIGIGHVRDTIVGTPLRRGVSGGQRKRLAVGVGLLRQPRVLVLDEPTCGLDSTTALNLIHTLRRIADAGAIVVMAIHQPQQAIFDLFDNLMVIRGGRIIYHAPAKHCVTDMQALGIQYDGVTAHADHIIEVVSPSIGQALSDKERTCPVGASRRIPEIDTSENAAVEVEVNVTKQPWYAQTGYLIARLATAELRKYGNHVLNIVCTLGCALLISAAYYNVPMTQQGSRLRLAVLFFCCINQSLFGAMKVVLSFPEARQLQLAERRAGFYSLSPYLTAFSVVDIAYTLVWPFLFALPVTFMCNLSTTASGFFGFVLVLLLDKLCATSLALMICAITRVTSTAVVVLPLAIEISRLFSGYFLAPNVIPTYFVWLDPLSYVKYAFIGASLNELGGQVYACTGTSFNATTNVTRTGICDKSLPTSGDAMIASNGYDFISYGGCIGALLGYMAFTRIVTYLALRWLKS